MQLIVSQLEQITLTHTDWKLLILERTKRGGGVDATPLIRFFFNFSKTIFRQHKPFSVGVGISLRHILRKFGENQFLWLRDMTSYVAGGQLNFGLNCVYFAF